MFKKTRFFLISLLIIIFIWLTRGLLISIEGKGVNNFFSDGYITFFEGDVFYYSYIDDTWETVTDSFPIGMNDIIKVNDDSLCEITFKDKSIITLEENTQIEIKELRIKDRKKNIKLHLDYGNLNSLVEKISSWGSYFEIESPAAVVGVRGTEFDVSYEKEDEVEVDVYDGEVEVGRRDDKGNIVEKDYLKKDQFVNILKNREIQKFHKLNENRKALREYVKNRIQYAKLDRSVRELNKNINTLQMKAIKSSQKERQIIQEKLNRLYESREELSQSRNLKAIKLSNMEEKVKNLRDKRKEKIKEFKKSVMNRFKDRIKQLPKDKREKIIKNRLQRLSPEKRQQLIKKNPRLQEKVQRLKPQNKRDKEIRRPVRRR
ncbi:MAG: FecR domain-containing protein [Candidatus Hydrogenedentota bacterium]